MLLTVCSIIIYEITVSLLTSIYQLFICAMAMQMVRTQLQQSIKQLIHFPKALSFEKDFAGMWQRWIK